LPRSSPLRASWPDEVPATGSPLRASWPDEVPATGSPLRASWPDEVPATGPPLRASWPDEVPATGSPLRASLPPPEVRFLQAARAGVRHADTMIDRHAAAQFIATHARLIDRCRFAHLEGEGSAEAVARALAAYRNDDGGLGQLEPDLRTPASQPACVLYALDILHEIGERDSPLAGGALDWLEGVSNDDGGVPFVLPTAAGWPHAPWFQPEEARGSSLLITAGIASAAHRLGLAHRWLDRATEYCWEHLDDALSGAYTLRSAVDFLDSVPDRGRAGAALDGLAGRLPAGGVVPVSGGADGEALRPLDLAPWPEHSARRLFDDAAIERELDGLAGEQRDDGGWTFSWRAWNPAVAWEWRGAVTVQAIRTLRAYGRLQPVSRP